MAKERLLRALTSLICGAHSDRAVLSDIEAAIKRCVDDCLDLPVDDSHVRKIIFLVSNSRASITFLSARIAARINRARNHKAARAPIVALKGLLLLHRLLRGADRQFERDLRNSWSLNRHLDTLASAFTADDNTSDDQRHGFPLQHFVSKYSLYLSERMRWMISQGGTLEPVGDQWAEVATATESLLFQLSRCQSLLDRVISFVPDSNWSSSPMVHSSFGIILKESFAVYESFQERLELMMMSSSFYDLLMAPQTGSASAYDILKKAYVQTLELHEFYQKCKNTRICKSFDFPTVKVVKMDQIPSKMNHISGLQFAPKLETTISTVWVQFHEDDQRQRCAAHLIYFSS